MNGDDRKRLREGLIGQLESLASAGVLELPRPRVNERPLELAASTLSSEELASPVKAMPTNLASSSPDKEQVAPTKTTAWASANAVTLFGDGEGPAKGISTAPTLEALRQEVAACTRCSELACTRKQTVFGVGNSQARLCFLGEAPGADEDRLGEPFVGRGGQLLDRIIAACKLKREEVYICNVLKCRPPGNRNPLPEEAANCRRFLERQLELVQPDFVCCLGAVAAQNLLTTQQPIGKLRGKLHAYRGAKVVCTYHPAYLLRNPAAKKDAWEDMKFLMREMGVEL